MRLRVIDFLVALAATLIGGLAAARHPLGQPLPVLVFALVAVVGYRRPTAWLVALPSLMPVVGLAPWTGWLTFEETDLLVLAFAAGGYARYAFGGGNPWQTRRTSALLILLAVVTALTIGISTVKGFADSGGFHFGWYQGYDGPMNSVRIGKSFFLALLLIPLLNRLLAKPENRVEIKLGLGLAGGLATASLAALWERLAFTDLLNFSSDYRTTALFWEMHVGGAALDGWLLLTAPFAVWAMRNARTHLQWTAAALLLAVGAYAGLTTFSRGVYLALPVGFGFLGWQLYRQRHLSDDDNGTGWRIGHWGVAVTVLAGVSALVFPTSGYRGLLALLGVIGLSLMLPAVVRSLHWRNILIGICAGIVLGLLLIALSDFLPKGPYVFYVGVLAACTAVAVGIARSPTENMGVAFLAGFVGQCFAASGLASHWGGEKALSDFLWALAILAVALLPAVWLKMPRWPNNLRSQGAVMVVAVVVSGTISIFSGGSYMGGRFSTSSHDFEGRQEHWRQAIAMLDTPWDLAFGKGLGRFPANYFFVIPNTAFPGTYHLVEDGAGPYLKLSGARHPISFGDILRVSQRLPLDADGPFVARVKARADGDVVLHLEVCEKHLLYAARCQIGKVHLKERSGEWQTADVRLEGPSFADAHWYAPRLKAFSIGVETAGKIADVAEIGLAGPDGRSLIVNGDFEGEMAHWFFSSDRDHLPWHAKNIFVNVLFDQGLFGLVLFVALTAAALWRLSMGKGRDLPLSPYLGAGIVGLLAVGLFDSLLDVPRLALLYYLIMMSALMFGKRRFPSHQHNRSSGHGPSR